MLRSKTILGIMFCTVLLCLFSIPISKSSKDSLVQDYETMIDPDQFPGLTNFEKLQNALNSVPPTGAIVLVPSKVYEGSNLTVPSKVRIVGANGTVFRLCDSAIGAFMPIDDRNDVVIENIVFDGNMERQTDADVSMVFIDHGCDNVLITNNTFRNFRYQAIASDFSMLSGCTRFITVCRNLFVDGEGAAILLRGGYADGEYFLENIEIYDNILCNLTFNGKIGVAFASNCSITGNQIVSCEATCSGSIAIRGCKNVYVSKNSISKCAARAGIFIEANMLFPNKGTFLIENNRISGQVGEGFSLSGFRGVEAEITLRKNFFTQNYGFDIETTNVTIYVYANIVDTLEDLELSATTVAWGNQARFGTGYTFIQSRAR